MRTIKFRGLRKDGQGWVHGSFMDNGTYGDWQYAIFDGNEFVQVKRETVGQFTGITDSKGTEIYEGDVVEECGIRTRFFKANKNGVVVFHNFYFSISWQYSTVSVGLYLSNGELQGDLIITGNIHERER